MEKRNHHSDREDENYQRRFRRWCAVVDSCPRPRRRCPTLEEIRATLARVRQSRKAQIDLGNMLLLLEQHEGHLVPHANKPGFKGGLRKFFAADPVLAKRYKTLMRYKNLAKNLTLAPDSAQ